MKKPGVIPISFLVKQDDKYKKYQFDIRLNNWNSASNVSIKRIKCDSSEYACESDIVKYFLTEDVFFDRMPNYYPCYIYKAIFGDNYPMKLEGLLYILYNKSVKHKPGITP